MNADSIPTLPSHPSGRKSAERAGGLTDAQHAFAGVLGYALADAWHQRQQGVADNSPVVSDSTPQTDERSQ